jgi:hypothetical protein
VVCAPFISLPKTMLSVRDTLCIITRATLGASGFNAFGVNNDSLKCGVALPAHNRHLRGFGARSVGLEPAFFNGTGLAWILGERARTAKCMIDC